MKMVLKPLHSLKAIHINKDPRTLKAWDSQDMVESMGKIGGMKNMGDLKSFLGSTTSTLTDFQSLRQLYSIQLDQIKKMGCYDEEKALQALQTRNGNVDEAIELIIPVNVININQSVLT